MPLMTRFVDEISVRLFLVQQFAEFLQHEKRERNLFEFKFLCMHGSLLLFMLQRLCEASKWPEWGVDPWGVAGLISS